MSVLTGRPWEIVAEPRFSKERIFGGGYAHLGFHGERGEQFVLGHWSGWVGALDRDGKLAWTSGSLPAPDSSNHIRLSLDHPMYVSGSSEGAVYVSCYGDRSVYRIHPKESRAERLLDGAALGMVDMGNCVVASDGCLWVNEVEGRRIWRLEPEGVPIESIGARGEPSSAGGALDLPFEDISFGWIADLRPGPGGSVFVLDSGGLALWRVDPGARRATRVAGSGKPGRPVPCNDATLAPFGRDTASRFPGPISLALDEEGNAFIGDKDNGLALRVDAVTGALDLIFEGLSGLCSMDYFEGRLFLPEEAGRLVVLERR